MRDNVKNANWEEVETRGDVPNAISFHCVIAYQNKLYVFGGVREKSKQHQLGVRRKISEAGIKELNPVFHVLNLQTLQWSTVD